MVSSDTIKEIILTGREFINNEIKNIIEREGIVFPEKLKKVKVIYGVRRSGKTFVLYSVFKKNPEKSLYIDFEDERLKSITLNDLEKIKDIFFELNPHLVKEKKVIFLFDEIQNIEGWEKFVRRLVERENIDVYVAGSSSDITPSRIHTSLRERAWTQEVYPFSFIEFLKAKNFEAKEIYGRKKSILKAYINEYLEWGGFPEVSFIEEKFMRKKILDEYLDAMFFKDLVEKYNITNITLLKTLQENLFSSFSSRFSLVSFYKKYKGKFPFSKDSLFSYYRYFLESMLIYESRIFSKSSYKRMRNPPKIYLVDAGLARRVKSEDYGRLLENVVFLELRRKGYEIYYFNKDSECDFVIKDNGKLQAIQVTLEINPENKEREIGGLIKACKFLDLKSGIIITRDQEYEEKKEGITCKTLPFWKWLKKCEINGNPKKTQ